jgi:hypothetical protein
MVTKVFALIRTAVNAAVCGCLNVTTASRVRNDLMSLDAGIYSIIMAVQGRRVHLPIISQDPRAQGICLLNGMMQV